MEYKRESEIPMEDIEFTRGVPIRFERRAEMPSMNGVRMMKEQGGLFLNPPNYCLRRFKTDIGNGKQYIVDLTTCAFQCDQECSAIKNLLPKLVREVDR